MYNWIINVHPFTLLYFNFIKFQIAKLIPKLLGCWRIVSGFCWGRKPEYPEKTPDVGEGPQTQLTYFPGQESNPGRIGERRVFLPLRHPDAPVLHS